MSEDNPVLLIDSEAAMLLQHAKDVWPNNLLDINPCPFCRQNIVLADAIDGAQSYEDQGVRNVGHYIGHAECILKLVPPEGRA